MPQPPKPELPRRRSVRRRLALGVLVLAVVVAVVLLALYIERGPIGARLAVDYLRQRGVPAVVRLHRIDTAGVVGSAVLGDPRDPDLTVERIEVRFEPIPLFNGGSFSPRIQSIRLVRPRLKARFDGRRLTFGSLQRLVDDATKAPSTGPQPHIAIEAGDLRLATPAGPVRVVGDAQMRRGRLHLLSARLQPALLRQGGFAAEISGAQVLATVQGRRLSARGRLSVSRFTQGQAAVRGLAADVTAEIPYNDDLLRPDGRWRIKAEAAADGAGFGPQSLSTLTLAATLIGEAQGSLARLGAEGSGTAALTAARWASGPDGADKIVLNGGVARLRLARDAEGFRFSLDGDLAAAAARASIGGAAATAPKLDLRLSGVEGRTDRTGGRAGGGARLAISAPGVRLGGLAGAGVRAEATPARAEVAWSRRGWSVSGPSRIRAAVASTAAPVLSGRLDLRNLTLDLRGQAGFGSAGLDGQLTGSLASRASLTEPAAKAIAASLPLVGTDPAGERAILSAFRSARLQVPAVAFAAGRRGWSATLSRPAELLGDGGARLAVAQADQPVARSSGGLGVGAMTIRLAGAGLPEVDLAVPRYQAGFDRAGLTFDAQARLDGAFTGESLKGLELQAPLRLTRAGGVIAAHLADCAPVKAVAFGEPAAPLLRAISLRACADGRPAVELAPRGWRVHARTEAFRADAPAGEAAIRDGRGTIDIVGSGSGEPAGRATVTGARIVDAAATRRFEPLGVSGTVDLARGVWSGPLALTVAAKGWPLAAVQVRHVMDGSSGSAKISVPALAFARDGLQPRDLSPLVGALASDAEGRIAFAGQVEWSPGRPLVSSGSLSTSGLRFRSPAGVVEGARADLVLSSLAPIETPPGQVVSADSVGWLTPLDKPKATFAIAADRLSLTAAGAGAARGRVSLDPLELPFAAGSRLKGVLRLDDVELGALVQQFDLADKMDIQAKVDGAVPFSIEGGSLKLERGHVFATGPGRLSIKREALTGAVASTAPGVGATPPNAVQDMAYQALENLAFDRMEADLASLPMGRLGVTFRINGRHDPPRAAAARIGLLDLVRGRAFDKPIPLPKGTAVILTLDTSLNFDELLAAYANRGRSEPVQPPPANTAAERP